MIEDAGQWRMVGNALPSKQSTARAFPRFHPHAVDQPAMLVDSPKQVLPLAANFHVRLVHAPRGRPVALIPADSLSQFRRVAMDPTHDRGRIYLHPALPHPLQQIAIGDPGLAVPANTHQDDLNRKTTTFEQEPS